MFSSPMAGRGLCQVAAESSGGWTRYVVTRNAEHATGRHWTYYGHVRVWALRLPGVTVYRSFMRARWPQVHASLRGEG